MDYEDKRKWQKKVRLAKELTENREKKIFIYSGYHSTVEFARDIGWREDPEVETDLYVDNDGILDQDRILNKAFFFIRSKGWKVEF